MISGQRAGLGPPCRLTFLLVQESKQRTPAPTAHVPPASPAGNLRRQALGAVRPNSLRACGTPFRHVAANLRTMQLHSAVQLPAPRACRHRRGQKGRYRMQVRDSFSIKLIAVGQIIALALSQFFITPAGRRLPYPLCVSACGTRFGLRALAPKSANDSCSDSPPFV